ncbi:MAG: hypothetical protein GXP33_16225, partial [Spirochaetes bacterium]|nr:hypothetical protein [Spirochaetota bacterium]
MYTGTWKTIYSTAVIARTILLLVLILTGIISCSRTVEKQKAETSSKPAETPPSRGARKDERFQNEIPAFMMQKALTHLSRRTEEAQKTKAGLKQGQKKDKALISSALVKKPTVPAVKKPVQAPAKEKKPVVIDREAPSLDIFSPSDFSIYQSSIEVRGKVGSPENEKNPMDSVEDVESLSWEIQDTPLGGNISFDKNGVFNFPILTAGYSKTLILAIKAVDKSGNTAVKNIYLLDDAKGPSLSVTSPQDNSYYPVKITVTGKVGNPLDPLDSPDEVLTLSWDIPSTPLSGYIYFDRDGLYNFSFSTSGIPDKVILHIRAADMNGHSTDKYIHLSDDGKGPWVKIISPNELDYYSNNITVEGIISDSENSPGTAIDVKSFSYSLLNIPAAAGNITVEPDGKFHFTVPASGLSGTQTLRLTAEDSHGNITLQTLTLQAKKSAPVVSPQKPAEAGQETIPRIQPQPAEAGQETAPVPLHRQAGQNLKPREPSTAGHQPERAKQQTEQRKPEQDLSKPFIAIDAPEKGYLYRTKIKISGRTGNSETQPDSVTNIKSINYSVSGIDRQGPVKINRDGSFSFSFSAAGLHGTQVIVIQAASKADIISAKSVIVREDTRGPLLSVTSPADNSFYSFSLIIRGRIANSRDDPDRTDEVKSIFYKIKGSPQLNGEIGFDAEGIFNLDIPVPELSGNQKLIITAEDFNDHTSESEINLFDGTMEPEITITRPKDNSKYGARLLIEGRITDPYRNNAYIKKKTTLSLDIFSAGFSGKLSTPLRKEITPDSGGMFRIIVPAKDFSGSQVISLTAKTWNGKEANKSIKIEAGNSDIPSFSVTAGDGKAEITWNPVPLASNYTIYYTDDGSKPSEVNG